MPKILVLRDGVTVLSAFNKVAGHATLVANTTASGALAVTKNKHGPQTTVSRTTFFEIMVAHLAVEDNKVVPFGPLEVGTKFAQVGEVFMKTAETHSDGRLFNCVKIDGHKPGTLSYVESDHPVIPID